MITLLLIGRALDASVGRLFSPDDETAYYHVSEQDMQRLEQAIQPSARR